MQNVIESIERTTDAKYIITVSDGATQWKLKWTRKTLISFKDGLVSTPEIPKYAGKKKFQGMTWLFSQKASNDYDQLMSIF